MECELAGVVRYTHYSMMIFGYIGVVHQPESPWREIVSVFFGIGTGLILAIFGAGAAGWLGDGEAGGVALVAGLVVAAAGNLDHDSLVAGIQRRCVTEPGTAPTRERPALAPVRPLVVQHRGTEQAHIVVGMRSIDRHDDDRFALSVLNQILGGGMSSRLFQEIREKRGLAYSVYSFGLGYSDAGMVYDWLRQAMEWYEKAEALRPAVAPETRRVGGYGRCSRWSAWQSRRDLTRRFDGR